MGDEPSGPVLSAEQRELDALRRRAYGPDADICDDPVAIARLSALEDLLRPGLGPRAEAPMTTEPFPSPSSGSARAAADPLRPASAPVAVVVGVGVDVDAASPPIRRRRTGLVAGAAVVVTLLGAAVWTAAQVPPADGPPSAHAKTAAVANERRAAGYEAFYERYLDGLRDEVLALPGAQDAADRMIRDQLKPYGILYGRTVGAGPTIDNRFCMIIVDLPVSSITCIPIENAYANPVSVILPSWYSDAESDLFTGLGEPISFTLMPGGGVVAVPADSPGGAASSRAGDGAAPAPTATPPPGWQ